jgi:hypothetical protein
VLNHHLNQNANRCLNQPQIAEKAAAGKLAVATGKTEEHKDEDK